MKQTAQSKALHAKKDKKDGVSRRKSRAVTMEQRSKKAGFYVHGHKNLGDVYEA